MESWPYPCDLRERQAGSTPSNEALGGRTHEFVDQRAQEVGVVYREGGSSHRLLARILRGDHNRGKAHQAGLDPLPLGGTTLSPTIAYWRSLLAYERRTLSEYRAEYDRLIDALKTGLPAAKIVVLGPFCPQTPSSYSSGLTTLRDVNQAAARAAGLPFIDVFYFTDANKSKYISDDNVHPNDAGHEYLGKRLGAELIEALR